MNVGIMQKSRLFSRLRRKSKPPIDSTGDGAQQPVIPPEQNMAEMGFLDHLEELRWRIFKGLGGVVAGIISCLFFYQWVINVILLGPKDPNFFMYRILRIELESFVLQNRDVTGEFFAAMGTVVVVGLIVGMPILLYQFWAFVEPGLYPFEFVHSWSHFDSVGLC